MMIKETIVDTRLPFNGWPPTDAKGFVAWIQEKIDRAPAEYRDSVQVEILSEDEYEEDKQGRPHIWVYYPREESSEETAIREEREAEYAAYRRAMEKP